MWKSITNRQGFALLDILIGVAIISVALVGMALTYRQSTVTTVSARNYNQATYYAQQALERLRINDGASSATWSGTTPVAATGVMPAFTIVTEQLANGEAPAYDALSSEIKAKLVPVRAKVTWREPAGAATITRTVEVVSYYYLK